MVAAAAAFLGTVGFAPTAAAQAAGAEQIPPGANGDWQAFADCAAAYRANIKSRESDPSRSPAMRNMIQEQADDYLRAAVHVYMQREHGSEEAATQAVDARIAAGVDRFVAMDKAGELDGFLEKCPQPDQAAADAGTNGRASSLPGFYVARSLSKRRKIFPDADFGIASTKSSRRTFLYGATRSAT
jgi:hypothetical protein